MAHAGPLKRWAPPALLLCAYVLLIFWLNDWEKTPLVVRQGQTFEKGVVAAVLQDNLQPDGSRSGEQRVLVRMTSGVRAGEEIEMTSSSGYLFGAGCTEGMRVIVIQSVAGDTTVSAVYSQDRGGVLLAFAGLYLLVLCLVGGKQGVKGALGLIFTCLSIVCVYLPMVGRGWSPFWSAVFVCTVTTLATMWLIGGPTRKTAVAVGGTVAGLLISTLGAVMDVSMSIASAIQEVYDQNPALTRWELFRSGMRVGRDLMGTDFNTLILAFAGTSVSMLVLDWAYDLPLLQIVNSNNIGIAVMQGLSGSFGVVLAVPATVALAVILYTESALHRSYTPSYTNAPVGANGPQDKPAPSGHQEPQPQD